MYTVTNTRQYRKSLKRHLTSGSFDIKKLDHIINVLSRGETLSITNKNHLLSGNYLGHWECHVEYDLLLVYTLDEIEKVMVLVDVGSHAHIFGM